MKKINFFFNFILFIYTKKVMSSIKVSSYIIWKWITIFEKTHITGSKSLVFFLLLIKYYIYLFFLF
jgi:hypothetical protein